MVRVLLLSLFLVGCAHTQPKVEYITVLPPEPPVIERPALPVLNIQPGDDAGVVLQLHRETIKVLQSYAKELEAALNAYRRKKDGPEVAR